MFDIGGFNARTCSAISRRGLLRLGASAPLGLGLASRAVAAERIARARSVVFVFLWGGPSHLDMCDPKPDAPAEYRGPFGVISTKTPGVQFTELLPKLSQRTDQFTLIRSNVSTQSGHPDGGTMALTGFTDTPVPAQPNFGAIVAKHRPPHGSLPSFFSIASGVLMDGTTPVQGHGGGTLGQAFDPFVAGCSELGEVNIPALKLLDGLVPGRIRDRRALMQRLDIVPRTLEAAGFVNWRRDYQAAYDLLLDPKARDAFDLSQESDAMRTAYGQSVFGQSSLLARRLVEAEVPYIQLNYSRHVEAVNPGYEFGWDTHIYNFELLQDQHCPIFDRAFCAFLDDMRERGLLDDTLVVCMGEFGRTPKISDRAARDHWPNCYFSIWTGAGIEPGRVIGASDRLGEHPLSEPISPLMVGTTICELAGIDTQARAEMNVLNGGTAIYDLI